MTAAGQDRLGTVRAMAEQLADRILMERLTGAPPPIAKGEALWLASLLLEENERPVPSIVTDVLAEFRRTEAANDQGTAPEPQPDEPQPDLGAIPQRVLGRLLRPFRAAASA